MCGLQRVEKNPGEIAFFKLLHSELKKAEHFFERAEEQYNIRERRVLDSIQIVRKPNSTMVEEKWLYLAKSVYGLYKDLLLLETYAIMTYCAFSKILKKHDKNTGCDTRKGYMANFVNKANFTNYPNVLEMIARCESMYEEVSENLEAEGKENLCEDERLFISMINRLNAPMLGAAQEVGAPSAVDVRKSMKKRSSISGSSTMQNQGVPSKVASSLRSLLEENDAKSEGSSRCLSDDNDEPPLSLSESRGIGYELQQLKRSLHMSEIETAKKMRK